MDAEAGVLQNDTDVDLDGLQTDLVTNPTDGALSLALDELSTPDDDFFGVDSFTYRAFDGSLDGTG